MGGRTDYTTLGISLDSNGKKKKEKKERREKNEEEIYFVNV